MLFLDRTSGVVINVPKDNYIILWNTRLFEYVPNDKHGIFMNSG